MCSPIGLDPKPRMIVECSSSVGFGLLLSASAGVAAPVELPRQYFRLLEAGAEQEVE